MKHTARRLDKVNEYVFASLAKSAWSWEKETGKKILDLSVGSPTFPPSVEYVNKLKEYMSEPASYLYPGYGAIPAFSDGLIQWYKTRFGVDVKKDELFPLLGGKDGVSHIPLALVDEGDEILVPNPGYPAFVGPALMLGAKVVPYSLPEDTHFKLSISEIEQKISSKTKLIWVNFPSNPTGQVASREELEQLVALCKKRNIWLIYDNAYAEIAYDGYVSPSILQVPGAIDVAVEIGSFSKMYSFAGFRMGWIVGNPEVIAAVAKVKSQFDSGLSYPLQKLGAYVLTHPDLAWHANMIGQYQKNKQMLIQMCAGLGLQTYDPQGSLYLWAKIPDRYGDSAEYAMELMKTKHILVTPGTAFGSGGVRHVRLSFSSDISQLHHYI
ncbi:MAG: pyridoxal phosphate-dependent aminotransferase [Candidatus Roizmanbacteria bacterium]